MVSINHGLTIYIGGVPRKIYRNADIEIKAGWIA